jgi:hypothetical protein
MAHVAGEIQVENPVFDAVVVIGQSHAEVIREIVAHTRAAITAAAVEVIRTEPGDTGVHRRMQLAHACGQVPLVGELVLEVDTH